MLSDLGGLTEARSHYRRALQIIESFYGPDNLDVAVILNNLGSTAKAQDDPAEARTFFAGALGIFRDNLGQDHPHTTITEEHLDTLPQTQLPKETMDDEYGYYL
jgi:tetratricopeptide (TPR) repeat protein